MANTGRIYNNSVLQQRKLEEQKQKDDQT